MTMGDVIGHFSLWGDFEAGMVTAQLGLAPSALYPKGETTLGDRPALLTTWDLHCKEGLTAEEQIESLLTLLWPRAEKVCELTSRFRGDLNIVGDADLYLGPTTLQKLAQLNVTLNFFNHKSLAEFDEAVSA